MFVTTLIRMDGGVPKSRWSRFWRRMSGRRVLLSSERTAGTPYCLITVRTDEGVPWPELEEAMGGTPAVFEKGVRLPAGFGGHVVDGEPLRRRLLLNGALRVLEEAAREGEIGEVALLDREGRWDHLLPRLMQVCRTVTVVTGQEGLYRRLSEQLYQTLGAAPVLAERAGGLSHCRALLAPEGLSGFGAVEKPPLLFSPDGREGLTLTEEGVPSPFPPALTEKYDLFALLTAFRGERLFRDAPRLIPSAFREGGRAVSLAEAVARFSP